MAYELTNDEKIAVITQHLKNLEYNKYNLEMSIVELNAVETVDETVLNSLQSQLNEADIKTRALQNELNKITEQG